MNMATRSVEASICLGTVRVSHQYGFQFQCPHSTVNLCPCTGLFCSKMQFAAGDINLLLNVHIQWSISIRSPVSFAPKYSFQLRTWILYWISLFNIQSPSVCLPLLLQNVVSGWVHESPPECPHLTVNLYTCACLFCLKMQLPAEDMKLLLNLHIWWSITICAPVSFAPKCSFPLGTWISSWMSTFNSQSPSVPLSLLLQIAVSSWGHESPPQPPHSMVNLHLCACLFFLKMQFPAVDMNCLQNVHIQRSISIHAPVSYAPKCILQQRTWIYSGIYTLDCQSLSVHQSLLLQNAVSSWGHKSPAESPYSTVNLYHVHVSFGPKCSFQLGTWISSWISTFDSQCLSICLSLLLHNALCSWGDKVNLYLCTCLFCFNMQLLADDMNLLLNLHIQWSISICAPGWFCSKI